MILKGSLMVEREQRKGKISKGVELGSHLSGKTQMEAVMPAQLEEGLVDPAGSWGHKAGCDETPERRLRKPHTVAVGKVKL